MLHGVFVVGESGADGRLSHQLAEAHPMVAEATRTPIGQRSVGSEPQAAKYGKRSRASAGTGGGVYVRARE